MKEQLIITIDADLKQEFRIKCIREKKSMTDIILELVKEYIRRKP